MAANEVVGYPLVLVPGSSPGYLKSTPVFDNEEVAAITGGVGGNDDNDDDDKGDDKDGDDEEGK